MTRLVRNGSAAVLALGAPSLLLAAPGNVVVAAELPFRRGADPADTYGLPLAAALGVVLLAACAIQWKVRRARAPAAAPRGNVWLTLLSHRAEGNDVIKLIASKPVGPDVRLHVVQWAGQQYLLSNNQATVIVLDRRSVEQVQADSAEKGPQ